MKEIPDDVSWTHYLLSPATNAVSGARSAAFLKETCLILAHIRKEKKIILNALLHILDLAHIQIHNHAYSLVGIYFEITVQAQVAQVVSYTTAENRK
jgi:hypothetical protein